MTPQRPTLREAEYRVRQWLQQQLWGENYVGKVIRRLVVEYDRRGRELGLPTPPAADEPVPAEDGPPCHTGVKARTCGYCADQPGAGS